MREKQDIIQVDKGILVKKVLKDIAHHGLEDSWGIGEAKKHYKVLKAEYVRVMKG